MKIGILIVEPIPLIIILEATSGNIFVSFKDTHTTGAWINPFNPAQILLVDADYAPQFGA